MNHRTLKPEEFALGMLKCQENAGTLIEEATFLASRGRYERAYFLAHTACEELSKFFILNIAGKGVCNGNPPDWKRFWQRFRSHDSKLSQLDLQFSIVGEIDETARDLMNALDILLPQGLFVRNASLYVDIGPDGKFRSPDDLKFVTPFPVLIEAANKAFKLALALGRTEKELLDHLQAALSVEDRKTAERVLLSAIERLKSAGVSRDEALKLIQKTLASK